jgi:hypothetical protein
MYVRPASSVAIAWTGPSVTQPVVAAPGAATAAAGRVETTMRARTTTTARSVRRIRRRVTSASERAKGPRSPADRTYAERYRTTASSTPTQGSATTTDARNRAAVRSTSRSTTPAGSGIET